MTCEGSRNSLMRKGGIGAVFACAVLLIACYFDFFFFLSLYLNVVLTSAELCSLFDFPWISICTTEQKTSGEHCLTQNFPILCAFS